MIIFAWPSERVKNIFDNDREVIFLDQHGLWVKTNSGRDCKPIEGSAQFSTDFDTKRARSRINWWAQVWERWFIDGYSSQDIRERSLLAVHHLFSALEEHKINAVIFHTSVPHHLDSALLSCACELQGVKQIYLYGEVIAGRLLPIIQLGEFSSRRALGFTVSNFSYNDTIDDFFANYKNSFGPITNAVVKKHNLSVLSGYYYLIKRFVLEVIKQNILKFRYKNSSIGWSEPSQGFSSVSAFHLLKRQRSYLKKLAAHYVEDRTLSMIKSAKFPYVLISAHFQPEATTFPEGDSYANHIDIAIALRAKGYNKEILYKEHPGSFMYVDEITGLTRVGIYRSPEYLERLLSLGCSIIQSDYSFSSADSSWYVPITIVGTIAIERSLCGLTTIYTGNPWWKGLPGTIHIDDISGLEEVPASWAMPDEETASAGREFLESMLTNKTIVNVPGIATGVPECSSCYDAEFEKSLCALVNWSDGP